MTADPLVPDDERQVSLRARGLSKVYGSGEVEVRALSDVDLDLYAGELVVLLGASGSGKSTLLNILGGLDTPSSGTVHFDGQEITASDDAALTREAAAMRGASERRDEFLSGRRRASGAARDQRLLQFGRLHFDPPVRAREKCRGP